MNGWPHPAGAVPVTNGHHQHGGSSRNMSPAAAALIQQYEEHRRSIQKLLDTQIRELEDAARKIMQDASQSPTLKLSAVVARLSMQDAELRAAENEGRRKIDGAQRGLINALKELDGEIPVPVQNRQSNPPRWQPQGPDMPNMNNDIQSHQQSREQSRERMSVKAGLAHPQTSSVYLASPQMAQTRLPQAPTLRSQAPIAHTSPPPQHRQVASTHSQRELATAPPMRPMPPAQGPMRALIAPAPSPQPLPRTAHTPQSAPMATRLASQIPHRQQSPPPGSASNPAPAPARRQLPSGPSPRLAQAQAQAPRQVSPRVLSRVSPQAPTQKPQADAQASKAVLPNQTPVPQPLKITQAPLGSPIPEPSRFSPTPKTQQRQESQDSEQTTVRTTGKLSILEPAQKPTFTPSAQFATQRHTASASPVVPHPSIAPVPSRQSSTQSSVASHPADESRQSSNPQASAERPGDATAAEQKNLPTPPLQHQPSPHPTPNARTPVPDRPDRQDASHHQTNKSHGRKTNNSMSNILDEGGLDLSGMDRQLLPSLAVSKRRRLSMDDLAPEVQPPKRARIVTDSPISTPPPRSSRMPLDIPRSIRFDEVYQNGQADYKHAIFKYPPSGPGAKWYIVKCEVDDHIVHFGSANSALHGAAKHLSGAYHKMSKTHEGAMKQLAWEVLGCTQELADKNNAVLERAMANGYVPKNTIHKKYTPASGLPPVDPASPKKPEAKRSDGILPGVPITRPEIGGLYYAHWPDDGKFYLVQVLGWDKASLRGLGLLADNMRPLCYVIDSKNQSIRGWAEGYEDDGPMEEDREFPVLFFQRPHNMGGWVPCSTLAPYNIDSPRYDDPRFSLDDDLVQAALTAYARAKGFTTYEQLKKKKESGQQIVKNTYKSDWVPQEDEDPRPSFESHRRRGGPKAVRGQRNKDDDYDPDVEMVDAPMPLRRESIRQSPRGAEKRNRPGSSRSETAQSFRGGGRASPVDPKLGANLTAKEKEMRGSSERQVQKESDQAHAKNIESEKSAASTNAQTTPSTSANASPTKRSPSGWATINSPTQRPKDADTDSSQTNDTIDRNGAVQPQAQDAASRTPPVERPTGVGISATSDIMAIAAAALENGTGLPPKPAASSPGSSIDSGTPQPAQQEASAETTAVQSSKPSPASASHPAAQAQAQLAPSMLEKMAAVTIPTASVKKFTVTAYDDGERSWSSKTTGESLELIVDETGKIARTAPGQAFSVEVDAATVKNRERGADEAGNTVITLQVRNEKSGKEVTQKFTFAASADKTSARNGRDFIEWVRGAGGSPIEPAYVKSAAP